MIIGDNMAKKYKELAAAGRCDYYMAMLSPEDFLRCKEYEALQTNHASQMLVFIMIIFVFLFIYDNKG